MKVIPRRFDEAIKAGYRLRPTLAEAVRITNKHFKGFNIAVLVRDLENLLKSYAKEPVEKEIYVSEPPPTLRIEYKSENCFNEKEGLYVSRTITHENDELVAYHEMLMLPESSRKQGLGKKIIAAFLEQYENMEVKRINLYAALSDGGAAWAKFGFKATKRSEMERILLIAEQSLGEKSKKLKVVRDTFNNYYEKEPDGKAFPIQNWVAIPGMETILKKADSHWHGCMDLTNSKDLLNFKHYVGQKR